MEEEKKNKLLTIPRLSLGLGLGTFGGWMLNPELFHSIVNAAWREEFFKMLLAFTVAGLVHRVLFRRDIEKTLLKLIEPVVDAINRIGEKADGLGDTVRDHGARIESLESTKTKE